MESVSVLFVCTGNICRSPTAEAVFRHLVREAGCEAHFEIDSAGTHGYHVGDPPDPRSVEAALRRGIDMRDLRAKKIAKPDFDRFHYIVAMDGAITGSFPIFARRDRHAALSHSLQQEMCRTLTTALFRGSRMCST